MFYTHRPKTSFSLALPSLSFLFLLFSFPSFLFLSSLLFLFSLSLQIFGAATAAMPHRFRRAWMDVQDLSNLHSVRLTHENVHPTLKRFIHNWIFLERSVLCLQVAIKIPGTSSHISQRFQHEEREFQNDTLCDVRPTHFLFYHINVVIAGSVLSWWNDSMSQDRCYSLPVSKIIESFY